jgi:hypothetical protein
MQSTHGFEEKRRGATGKGETLTDPVIRTLSTGDDEDLASCPSNRDGATHDPRCRTTFCRHDDNRVVGNFSGE